MKQSVCKNDYIYNVFRYIENNISDDLDTALLSIVGYVSRDKLYHDFYNISGHSVKEYVRKRRLSNALSLIKTSDINLTDIAYQCGYSSHQALCRSVKQTLGLTPTEYKNGDIFYFFPPFNGESLQTVIVSNEIIPHMLCVRFYHPKLTGIENAAINTFLQAFPNFDGRIFGRNGKQKNNRFCYEIYITDINKNYYDILMSYGFDVVREIPCVTGTFATSAVRNEEKIINAAWDYLYSQWLQNSMFENTDEPYYEEYILKNGKPVKLKLFLPIKKRGEETRIAIINNPGLRFITAKAKGYNAEETASQTVIDYLAKHYPHIINISKELYLQKEINVYICGVRISPELQLIKDENIADITTDKNKYIVLESSVMGDYYRYVEMIVAFASDNGMDADKTGVFAVYETKKSFNNIKIKMYCPIKIHTK